MGNHSDSPRGPRKFHDPSTYTPGAFAAPITKETPMESLATAPAPAPSAPASTRAKVLRFDAEGRPLIPGPGVIEDVADHGRKTPITGSRAVRITGAEATATEDVPAWMQEFSEEERTKLAELAGSDGGVEKAFLHLQRKLGEQGSLVSGQAQQIQQMLDTFQRAQSAGGHPDAPSVSGVTPPDVAKLQSDIDAIVNGDFLADVSGNLKKLTEAQTRLAEAKVAAQLQALQQTSQAQTVDALLANYPGLLDPDPVERAAEAHYVDALVEGMGKPTMENYKKALERLAKRKGWTPPQAGARDNPEVQAMREAASATAPIGARLPIKGKIYRRSELESMQLRNPDKYRELSNTGELARAYAEGRVV